ncbi:tyrosyl-DNA phosphodiesterase 1 [Galdieria sulphuraria]|uniref:Tyrosyl-DNA phosphodiesterase 1 n=1 Tax=Galdieria sulphuraria TaxID=130081 RepID=M2VZC3_GALSU|nr:tyrosyl-DNA phosphodiesterase 1 [Galdieria sulphuraria]EME28681.1 tyrosyl-DNA phosphodiesterase 1 [Galdieria sulphuraria]|eukprot:XP_005705201.1 tyrosyl-DNA phosphodiesterase 1 [Galdieria sulphuraria]
MSQKDLVDSLGFYLNQVEGAISIFTKSLDEIFQPGFHSVLLTNYMFDLSWLFQRVPILLTVERLLIVHGDEQVYQPFSPYHFITFHKPRLPFPYGTHHTKLIILFYPTKVRFVLTTANMIQSDWEYKTQGMFLKDFPQKTGELKSCPFLETMDDYLSALGEPLRYYRSLLCQYDFSKAGVVLIPSVPGYHGGRNLDKYGHRSLHSNISQYCCISDEQRIRRKTTHSTIRLLLQCSSMGSISEKWLKQELFHSMVSSCWKQEDWQYCFEWDLIWPSVQQVRNSIQGYASGAAFPWTKKNYRSFQSSHLCLWNAYFFRRNAWLPHMKSYMAYEESGNIFWFLLTSANLSTAAWGRLVRNQSQLFIRSYELGVLWTPMLCSYTCPMDNVIQLTTPQHITSYYPREKNNNILFCLPLPFQLPPQHYDSNDSPWLWDAIYKSPDRLGNVWPLGWNVE